VPRRRAPASLRGSARPQGRRCGESSLHSPRRRGKEQGSRPADLSAPLIPLTLRAMHRTRFPRARGLSRPALLLLSVLALLAMALFPVAAQAEESAGINYETSVPTVGNETKAPVHHNNVNNTSGSQKSENPKAGASSSPGGGGGGGGNSGGGGQST